MTLEEALSVGSMNRTQNVCIEWGSVPRIGYFYKPFSGYDAAFEPMEDTWCLALWYPDEDAWGHRIDGLYFDEVELRMLLAGCTPYPQE